MKNVKKLWLLVLLCFAFTLSYAQNNNWMLGAWEGEGSSSNNAQFIKTIVIDSVSGESFSGTLTSAIKNHSRFKIITSFSGSIDKDQLHITNGKVFSKKDPPNGEWTDCSSCLPETKVTIQQGRIVLTSHIAGCKNGCNSVSVYYKLLCDYDTTTRRYLVNRFGTASDQNLTPCEEKKPVPADTLSTPAPTPALASTAAALETRNNVLLQTYHIATPDILIELFDNAEIDGDRVSVYHNDTLIVNNKTLLREPITINIHANAANRTHEFILIAENLGSIPPNTALMRITVGKEVYKLSVKTDLKTNAKIVFYYDGN
jgi:hypothetical protein